MKLSVWTYEGPPHVGAMRVATALRDVHLVLHAPQGDTYADLLFTMIERRSRRPPVTYTTFQARDLGADTADVFQRAVRDAYERFRPELLLVGASCTAELIQDDPAGIAKAAGLPIPIVPVELSAYTRKENWGAAETFYRVVRACCPRPEGTASERSDAGANGSASRGRVPRCNILGPTALGFRHRDDLTEIERLLARLGVEVNVVAPLGASPADLARLPDADFNVLLYPELAASTARYLEKTHAQPCVQAVPYGVGGTRDFVRQVAELAGIDPRPVLVNEGTRLPWYSRSIDSTYLTGKRVFVYGDATHALGAARVASEELGFEVVGLGTYSREQARDVRAAAKRYGVDPLISDDHLEVEDAIAAARPELVLGTQMERHIAKRLGLPCSVISAPVHVHDYPARYAPQLGYEGANVLFDTWVHPLMMGLEEHLLGMFRDDFEFAPGAQPSHLGASHTSSPAAPSTASAENMGPPQAAIHTAASSRSPMPATPMPATPMPATPMPATPMPATPMPATSTPAEPLWTRDAERELRKVPFFVRGRARRNTETFARDHGFAEITLETLYEAKAHFQGR